MAEELIGVRRRRKRRHRTESLNGEIRRSAKSIYNQQMGDAMKAAALMVVARKLDEVRQILVACGLNSTAVPVTSPAVVFPQTATPAPPIPAAVTNPCVHCGRSGIYKTKPNQFNKTGSWFCRTHMALGGQIEAEDRFDRSLTQIAPAPPPEVPPTSVPPAAGASSLSEAMGLAELVNE